MGRTDRVLISAALILLLLTAGSFFGVDQWLFPEQRDSGRSTIAELVSGQGDVRVKFNDQFQWQKGRLSQKLVYDDAVFAGEGSKAELRIGESKLDMNANTLIILRQEKTFKSINLARGMLSGNLAKNEQLVIETGDGERFELKAVENSKVVIERKGTKTAVKVASGNATMVKDGKRQKLTSRSQVEFVDRAPRKADPILFVAPVKSRFYSRENVAGVDFSWKYASGRPPKNDDEFILEFAEEASFKKIVMRENLLGHTEYSAGLNVPQSLYYRVRDGKGNFSTTGKIRLDRPAVPVIVSPPARDEFEAGRGDVAPVVISVQAIQPDGQIQIQVGNTPDFANPGVDATSTVPQMQYSFQPGDYLVRARSRFDDGKVTSDWSQPVPFHVREGVDRLHLRRAALKTHIVIPNLNYPPPLYSSSDRDVQKYLSTMTPFPEFFKDLNYDNHTLMGHRAGRGEVSIQNGQFPPEWIEPGLADYGFRLDGLAKFAPLSHRMVIEMEAPNNLRATRKGSLSWSPILLAKSYEGQLISEMGTDRFESASANHQAFVEPGTRYRYRVRALGKRGVPISAWSSEQTFETPQPPPPPPPKAEPPVENTLARNERIPAADDQPANKEAGSLRVKKEERDYSLWKKIGWWLWSGGGVNFVKVNQTINNTADVEYKNTKGPSAYVEAGYLSSRKLGAVVSYKRTPGEVQIGNYPINKTEFVWTTASAEGLWSVPWYVKVFDLPVAWILRAGVQNHTFPFLYVDSGNRLIQGTNHMMTGSLGFLTETLGSKMKYYWSMRYQQPISSGSEGGNSFEVTPTIAFDGSVGASYNFTNMLKTGLFWYGQLHQYDFNYQSKTQTNTGHQSLFYSNIELRLGVDF